MIKSDGGNCMEKQACVSHINQGLWMVRVVSSSWLFWGPWLGFQCIPEACPFCLAQWGARWRLRSPKSSPRSCVHSDPSLQGGVVGQGPAFVRRRILWPIVRRPQPFRDFKGSFAQFLLSATLSTEKQESSGGGWGLWFFNVKSFLKMGKKWKNKMRKRERGIKEGVKTEVCCCSFLIALSGNIVNRGPWNLPCNVSAVSHHPKPWIYFFSLGNRHAYFSHGTKAHVVMGIEIPAQTHHMFS